MLHVLTISGGQIDVPYIDLVFAVSATSNNSTQTYALMQNTIKQFIDQYGADKIHYSVIAFGDTVVRVVDFNHTFPPTANELKAAIDAQLPLAGGPVLVNALEETRRIFNETKARPNARKVLVVMTDENSGADEKTLATAVRPLEDDNILVISVVTGAANRSESLVISPNPLDVISTDDNQDPIGLSRRIMDRILRESSSLVNRHHYICLDPITVSFTYAIPVNQDIVFVVRRMTTFQH